MMSHVVVAKEVIEVAELDEGSIFMMQQKNKRNKGGLSRNILHLDLNQSELN